MSKKFKPIINAFVISFLMILVSSCVDKDIPSSREKQKIQALQTMDDGEFGVVDYGKSKTLTFNFTNNDSTAVSAVPTLQSGVNFQIVLAHKCSVVDPGKVCMVRVLFSTSSKLRGTYSDTLTVGDAQVALSATIPGEGELKYEFSVDESVVNESLVLPPLKGRNVKVMNLRVKNNSPFVGSPSNLSISNNKFTRLSGCENIQLKPGKSCFSRVLVKGENINDVQSSVISFDDQEVVVDLPREEQTHPRNMVSMDASFILGDFFQEGTNKYQIIKVKNEGLGVGSIDSSEIVLPSSYSLKSNNCANIAPGRTCYIQLLYVNPSQNKGQHAENISIGDEDVDFIVNEVTDPSKLSHVEVENSDYALVNSCTPLDVVIKDVDGNDFISSSVMPLAVNHQLFNDNACVSPKSSFDAFEGGRTFYVTNTVAGIKNITVEYGVAVGNKSIHFYSPLVLTPSFVEFALGGSHTFSPSGGVTPYTFEKVSGVGTINPTTGVFSSSEPGLASIKVSDHLGQEVSASVDVLQWPMGSNPGGSGGTITNGHLVVGNTQTHTLYAGTVYDFKSVTIQAGGTLNIAGKGIVVLGSKGDVVINGNITTSRWNDCGYTHSFNDGLGVNYSKTWTQSAGGNGGRGGGSGGLGGTSSCGWGAGGGGGNAMHGGVGGAGGSGQANGGNCTWFNCGNGVGLGGQSTTSDGAAATVSSAGGKGGNGQGGGGGVGNCYEGGGGGGGGGKGGHANSLVIKTRGSVSGTGSISLQGGNGVNGGNGGKGAGGGSGGAGGGGGAGGSGGNLWIRYKGTNTFTNINVSGGALGSGGSGGTGGSNGAKGADGSAGSPGTYSNSTW